jgi:rubrerythrin
MADLKVVRTIDNLHALEGGSLLQRYAESETFLGGALLEAYAAIEEMIADEREHLHRLADLLDELDATPGPRRFQVQSGNLHYSRPSVLLPQLIADKERLAAQYESALARVAESPRAAEVVSGILARHRTHLERLRSLLQAAPGK